MKFLVDAQLPRRLAHVLHGAGYDTLHTLDLPARNLTTDQEITRIAIAEERIVITKDADFVESFIFQRRPPKLLVITTGNLVTQNSKHSSSQHFQRLSLHSRQTIMLNYQEPL